MKNCNFCGKPLKKIGRIEHYGCRAVKWLFGNKSREVQPDSTKFKTACKTLRDKPELFKKMEIYNN